MLKARVHLRGREMIVLGLTRENTKRLFDNQPIMFAGSQLGLNIDRVVIIAGETYKDLEDDLRAIGVTLPS